MHDLQSAVPAVVAAAAVALLLLSRRRAAERARDARLALLESLLQVQQRQLQDKDRELRELRERGADVGAKPPLYRIVLTGGPCGGKTTALAKCKARLEELGLLVVCVPETAAA